MKYGSICSGIEAASVAWHPLGWRAAFLAEVEKFPSAVLAHHYPDVPNHGDVTKFKEWPDHAIDLLVGGTPCQSFSVAGLRKGLDDPRGNLMLTYLAVALRYRPRWLVWENVPGVLSVDGGRAFGTFLGGLAQLGYGFAYRVLDAQYVRVDGLERAVPQRRRRVFVVGYLGDWRRAAAVLFEPEGLSGHPAPRRKAGKGIAPTIAARTKGGGGLGTDFDCDGGLVTGVTIHGTDKTARVASYTNVAGSLRARPPGGQENSSTTAVMTLAIRGRGDGHNLECREDGTANAILTPNGGRAGIGVGAVAFAQNSRSEVRLIGDDGAVTGALAADVGAQQQSYVATGWAVRRLMPLECERLQGFPDHYTDIPYRNKTAADGPRYKALGNSMAVNVMRWIGQRIEAVETISQAQAA